MKSLGLGIKTNWLGLEKDIGGVSCTEVKWFVVICRLILQLDSSQICRHLTSPLQSAGS